VRDSYFASAKDNSLYFKKGILEDPLVMALLFRLRLLLLFSSCFFCPAARAARAHRALAGVVRQVDQADGLEFTRDHRVPEPAVAVQAASVYSQKGRNDCQNC